MALDLSRPLRRNTRDAMLGGVCAGIGDYLNWDHTVVRVLLILVTLFTGLWPGVLAYVVLWLITPPADVGAAGEQTPPSPPPSSSPPPPSPPPGSPPPGVNDPSKPPM